jgi:hypothetical protein
MGHGRGAVGPYATSVKATWHRSMAPPPCHVTDPREGLHTASPPLIQVNLIQRMMPNCLPLGKYKFYTWYSPSKVLHDSPVRLQNSLSYIHTYESSTPVCRSLRTSFLTTSRIALLSLRCGSLEGVQSGLGE